MVPWLFHVLHDVLLTGETSWAALPDGLTTKWEQQCGGGQDHAHSSGSTPEALEQLLGLASQDGLRAGNITSKLGEQPVDGLLGFIFDSMFSDDAVKQITECEGGLRKLYGASPDPRKTQRAILRCLQKLVTDSPHAGALISQTPALLKALYDIDLLEADVVVEWHAQGGEKRPAKGAAVKVREAAEPFVNWLKEAKPMEL